MALISGEMRELRAQRLAPEHGLAAIAGVAKVKRVRHFRNETPYQLGIAAIAIAGKHQRAAADLLARAVRPLDFDAAHAAVRPHQQPLGGSLAKDGDIA